MARSNSSHRLRAEDYVVDPTDRPGWVSAYNRLPDLGEEVYCAAGTGVVQAIAGKTSDGSRLLEIRLPDPKAKPFFAAASNVLVAPD
jgi:hypothetical protein